MPDNKTTIQPSPSSTNPVTTPATNPKPPPKKSDKKEKKGLFANKKVTAVIEFLKTPFVVGAIITIMFLGVTQSFYNIKQMNDYERSNHPILNKWIFTPIETLDSLISDVRFKFRGQRPPSPRAALLAIDNASVEELGRFPWSREKIAFIITEMKKYGAAAIGFDITFSEEQEDQSFKLMEQIEEKKIPVTPEISALFSQKKDIGDPDTILGKAFENDKERLVLGGFGEGNDTDSGSLTQPYQDYCRNEAFKYANAAEISKGNSHIIISDLANPYADIDLKKYFEEFFQQMEEGIRDDILKAYFPTKGPTDLSIQEINKSNYLTSIQLMEQCNKWNGYIEKLLVSEPKLKAQFAKLFASIPELSKLFESNPVEAFEQFKRNVLPLPVEQYTRWTINHTKTQSKGQYTGFFNAYQDRDGTIRHAPLLLRTGNNTKISYIPSLPFQTYLLATGYQAKIDIDRDPKNKLQKTITRFQIVDPKTNPPELIQTVPIDAATRIKINYAGRQQTYPYLAAKELFNGKETAEIEQLQEDPKTKELKLQRSTVKKIDFIKDRAFIFGATATGIYDLRVTPFDANFPGPETHVNVLGNLFDGNLLRYLPAENKYMLLIVLIVGFLLSYAISTTTAIPGFIVSFGSGGLLFVADQVLIRKYGLVATSAIPGLLIVHLYVVLFFYKYLTEERKKKYLRSTFSKYVSPAIVDEILKDPENIELGGKKLRMSVFFSDVRGFTTFSEKLDPQVLGDVLNRYLTPMTNIVFANKGTLDKYMGDAIMAFFGAPIYFPDHAHHAARCALESMKKLKEVQAELAGIFESHGLKGANIDIGIGINTGDMSAGNMGSDIVRSYTVMGDAVNLGSRLEGITKEYGVKIVVSEFTQAEIADKFTTRELDWVKVKGKLKPVRIFELMCEGKPPKKLARC